MSNSGSTTDCKPFNSDYTYISLILISTGYLTLSLFLFRRYCQGNRCKSDFKKYQPWRYRLPGWPADNKCRGSATFLFAYRLFNLCLALSCIIYQYLPIHYHSAHGVFNTTEPPHSQAPHMYRFYTVWNFHLVLVYFAIGTWFSYQGMTATKIVQDVQQIVIEPHHESSYTSRSAGLPKLMPQALEKIQHAIMNVELTCAPLICLVVWTILFEGVAYKDGLPEAIVKFITYNDVIQHLVNVFMVWTDFYLNDLSVITSHVWIMYFWMLTYTMFHSLMWVHDCFLAYPFMNLKTAWVFLYGILLSALHAFFYGMAICCSKRKRRAMDNAHHIDPSKLLDSSTSSVGSIQDGRNSSRAGYGGGGGGGGGVSLLSEHTNDSAWARGSHEKKDSWGSDLNSSSYLMIPTPEKK
jgi:uncharacterized membrane protein YgcG